MDPKGGFGGKNRVISGIFNGYDVHIFSTDFDGKRCFVQVKKMGYFFKVFETFLRLVRYRYSVFSRTTYMMI